MSVKAPAITPAGTVTYNPDLDGSESVASAAGAVWEGVHLLASTATVSGSTNITTATGFNLFEIERPTITSGSALTVTNAATVYIANSPLAAGSTSITNAYSLWVDAGISRFDGPIYQADGSASAPSYSFAGASGTGHYLLDAANLVVSINGTAGILFGNNGLGSAGVWVGASGLIGFDSGASPGSGAPDVRLARDAAAVLALKNGTTAQQFRIYGTTSGSKYLNLYHDGTDAYAVVSSGTLNFSPAGNIVTIQNGTNAQTLRVYGTTTGPQYLSLHHDGTDCILNTTTGGMFFQTAGTNRWAVTSTRFVATANYGFSHGTSALATNATEGFFHLNSCAGAAAGTPASIPTGQCPMVFDTTNARLYIYHGGAWHYIAQTA